MGIHSLLPFLEKSTRDCHVSEFRGGTVAVDSYCWLHKGARACAEQLVKGEKTNMHILYCIKLVKLLLSFDVKPIMVFDGKCLPAKLKTESKRRENKKSAKRRALELLTIGRIHEAQKFFRQCIDITPEIALELIKECRKLNVDCIVAPYESDAQAAFLNINGYADCVITEDSDLMLFGCKKVLYKMDINGCGQLVESEKIHLSMNMKPEVYTFDKFRHMCILSGCDYVDSLYGIGLKTAFKFITMTAETNPTIFLDKIPSYLKKRHLVVDKEYKKNFLMADATFCHQTVFDPAKKILVPLTPLDFYKNKPECLLNSGEFFDNNNAFQLAIGNLNPGTMKIIDNFNINSLKMNFTNSSIWSDNYRPRQMRKTKKIDQKVASQMGNIEIKQENMDLSQQNLEEELEKYKNFDEIKPKSEEIAENFKLSPVLERNPKNVFLKKKISKFNLTEVSENVVVSRFFHTQNKNEGDGSAETGNNMTTEQVVGKMECSQRSFVEEMDCAPINASQESTDISPSQGSCSSVSSLKENIETDRNIKRNTVKSLNNPQFTSLKKLKMKTDRDKKQLTIQEMFRNIKK